MVLFSWLCVQVVLSRIPILYDYGSIPDKDGTSLLKTDSTGEDYLRNVFQTFRASHTDAFNLYYKCGSELGREAQFVGSTPSNPLLKSANISINRLSSKERLCQTANANRFPHASRFYVDGSKIPALTDDVGPSWSGLLPISAAKNESDELFFWFWPATQKKYQNKVVLWLNGGPGCSSMAGKLTRCTLISPPLKLEKGFLQENGAFTWKPGQASPSKNEQ